MRRLLLVALALAGLSGCEVEYAPNFPMYEAYEQLRQVKMKVRVQDPEGNPVDGVRIVARRESVRWESITQADGRAELSIFVRGGSASFSREGFEPLSIDDLQETTYTMEVVAP